MATLTASLRAEYQSLFDTCQIAPERQALVNAMAEKIVAAQARYRSVAEPIGVPWVVVAVIHAMEAGLRFDCHLHNGDPLLERTLQVPANRPRTGAPPFSWEHSASDALRLEKYEHWSDWSVPGILFKWERFNGWGYRRFHPEVKSPYLWSFTNHGGRGKYVADGTWSATAVSGQVGAAALLRRLAERGMLEPSVTAPRKVAAASPRVDAALRFQPNKATPGGMELQRFLNRFPGIFLREDGKLGPQSSAAFRQLFGQFLLGDPRAAAAD